MATPGPPTRATDDALEDYFRSRRRRRHVLTLGAVSLAAAACTLATLLSKDGGWERVAGLRPGQVVVSGIDDTCLDDGIAFAACWPHAALEDVQVTASYRQQHPHDHAMVLVLDAMRERGLAADTTDDYRVLRVLLLLQLTACVGGVALAAVPDSSVVLAAARHMMMAQAIVAAATTTAAATFHARRHGPLWPGTAAVGDGGVPRLVLGPLWALALAVSLALAATCAVMAWRARGEKGGKEDGLAGL